MGPRRLRSARRSRSSSLTTPPLLGERAVLAGAGAWSARRDSADDRPSALRRCGSTSSWAPWLRSRAETQSCIGAVAVLGRRVAELFGRRAGRPRCRRARETLPVSWECGLDLEWPLRDILSDCAARVSQVIHENGERDRWHRRAVELLAQQGAPSERQALHLLVVAPAGQAQVSTILRTAAQLARDRGAPVIRPLRFCGATRALAEPPPSDQRHELLTELAEVKHAAGHSVAAADYAAEAFESAPDATTRARVLDVWGTVVGPDLVAMASLAPLVRRTLTELGEGEREIAMRRARSAAGGDAT